MTNKNIENIIRNFSNLNILIVGDIMLDSYIIGKVERISPEAPVPVLNVTKKDDRLGGLGNVALNLKSLSANVILCSVTGRDENAKKLESLFKKSGIDTGGIIFSDQRLTTVKTRVISNAQHVIRIDEEETNDLNSGLEKQFLDLIALQMNTKKIDAILFEDYNKGVLTEKVITQTIKLANEKQIPICVDPKRRNFFTYKNCTLFKPNLKELTEGLKMDFLQTDKEALQDADNRLRNEINHKISLFTLSEKGVFISDGNTTNIIPAHLRNIADVSGAGDTVIAVATLALASKTDLKTLAFLANLAGGIVCESSGVVPIELNKLLNEAIHG